MRWQDELMAECWRVIDGGGGEVYIKFCPRSGNKLRPIIRGYPDNETICDEVEVEKD